MRLSVLALAAVPDTESGRRVHDLDGLDDAAVGKILFHKRKQQAGAAAPLLLQQQRLAGASVLTYANGHVGMRTLTVPEHTEADLLGILFGAVTGPGRLITWGGGRFALPLLRLRAMRYSLPAAAFWGVVNDPPDAHLDLQAAMQLPPDHTAAALHQFAVTMGLPGLPDAGVGDPWDWATAGDRAALCQRTDLEALNLYLLGLRYWKVTGGLSRHDVERAKVALRDELRRHPEARLRAFVEAWTAA